MAQASFQFPTDARTQENLNQARIRQGIGTIDTIFGGGQYGTGQADQFKLGQQYYDAKGNLVQGPSTNTPAWQLWQGLNPKYNTNQLKQVFGDVQAQSGNLFSGFATSKGFDDAFYKKASQGYEDFALPQLATQFNQTNQQLQSRIANQGIAGGSAALKMNSALNRETGLQKQNIANVGLGIENDLRTKVGNEKNNVINQLLASGNPALAQQSALSSIRGLSGPSPLPSVGNLFSNFVSAYMNSQQQPSGGGGYSGLRLPSTNSQTNVFGIGD